MRNTLNNLLFFLALAIVSPARFYSQNVAACNNPQAICGNPNLLLSSTTGTGLTGAPSFSISNPVTNPQPTNANGGPINNGCIFTNAPNPEWLLINVTATGTLGFSFGANCANAQTSYLHWIMWPYTATTCADIFNNTLPPVSCNYNCVAAGGTGMGPVPPGGNVCNYQPAINVVQGEQYLILVSNTSGVPGSYCFNTTPNVACSQMAVNNVTACPGQATVTTANWPTATGVTYTLIAPAPGGYTVTQVSPNFTVSNTASSVYTVLADGTNAFGQPITASQNFTLVINPTATMSVAHATNYCDGSTASFTITPGTGTTTVSGPGGIAPPAYPPFTGSTFTAGPIFSPQNNGVWTFTTAFPTGCVGTDTVQVNVAPNLFVTVTQTVNVCQNGVALLNASMNTANSYTWIGPGAAPMYTFIVNSAINGNTTIANVQPNAQGTYTVFTNINFNGIQCPRSATMHVAVVQTHTVTVTPSYTYCQGQPVVLTGSTTGFPTGFSWNGPNGYSSTTQTTVASPNTSTVLLTNSVTPFHNGNYNFIANFSNSQLNCQTTGVVNIQVVPVGIPAVLVPSLICQYSNANMLIVGAGGNVISYAWSGPNSFTASTAGSVIQNIQPTATGIYTGAVVYAIGTRTCAAEGYAQITVVPVNSITVIPPQPACYPENVSLISTAIGATSYFWTGPNSFTANTANATVYYAPLNASGIYTITTTYNTGGFMCSNTNTVLVSVNPVMSFTLPGYIQTCPGASVTLPGPAGATSYTWTSSAGIPTGVNINQQDLVFPSLSPDQTGTYFLNIMLGPCPSTRSMELSVLTPIQFSLTPLGRTICRGDTILLEAGATGGSENYAYEWFPSSYLSAPTGSVITGVPFGTTVYNLKVHDIACPNYTLSHAFSVDVKIPPEPKLTLDRTEGCQPLCLFYNSNTQNEAEITTYDFGGVLKMQADSFTYCLNQPGTYTLRILSEGKNGCDGVYEHPVKLVVYPKANAEIVWTPDVPTSAENLVTFSAIPKAGNIAYYNWMFSGTGSSTEDTDSLQHPQRKFDETGRFPVMLISTTDQGCMDTSIAYIEIKDDLNLFIPNSFTPNGDGINDLFQVKGLGFKVESFVLEIFDRWGHSIYSTKDFAKGWDGTVKGQTPMEGVYVYKVRIIGANGEGRKEYIGHVTLLK